MSGSPSLLELLFTAGDAGDVDSFGLYLHDDVVVHAPAGLSTVGIEEERASWRKATAAMPDLRHEFVDVLKTESGEAARTVVSGTMSGTYGGLSAKGRHFSTDQAVFARVRDGKISEMWEIVDVSAIGSQLAAD
ncbi:MAG: ester cyclase [Desulfobacterales bacterium]|nr:ester cyclase [Desulfobacterales bacterium]